MFKVGDVVMVDKAKAPLVWQGWGRRRFTVQEVCTVKGKPAARLSKGLTIAFDCLKLAPQKKS